MAAENTFTLIINIRGLCLFVPHTDEATGKDHMHVLLPETRHHSGMEHIARISFDPRYNLDPASGRDREDFNRVRWNLSSILNTGADLTLPAEVPNVAPFVRPNGIRKKQVKVGQQVKVSSHLVLSAGGWACRGRAALWTIAGQPHVPMTNEIVWVIDGVPGTELKWTFGGLGGPGRTPDALKPVDGEIVLSLLHAPPGEHTGGGLEICNPGAMNHFHMYYDVFEAASNHHPVCEGEIRPPHCRNREELAPPIDKGPNVFTCMIGKTGVDPNS